MLGLADGSEGAEQHRGDRDEDHDLLPVGRDPCEGANTIVRTKSDIAATFAAAAKKAVTGVGEPSYTSGVHMWNGTAETLKARPAMTKTMPKRMPKTARHHP